MKKQTLASIVTGIILLMIWSLFPFIAKISGIDAYSNISMIRASMLIFSIAFFVLSILLHIFRKQMEEYCSLRTTCLSILISAVGSLGLYAAFIFYLTFFLGSVREHPIVYNVGRVVIPLSFLLFCILLVVYILVRRKKIFSIGTVIDIIISIIFIIPFWSIYAFIQISISDYLAIYYDKIG